MDNSTDYHPGEQIITEQVATYDLFGSLTKWGSLIIAVLVLVLTLWFCLSVGFFGGAIPGVVLLGLGILFLRSKPAPNR
jgi:uncharacterized membrane protein